MPDPTRRSFLGLATSAAAGLTLRAGDPALLPLPGFPDPAQGPGEGWSIVVFPDTQNYAKFARNQPLFESVTRWVVDHIRPWDIRLALHVGDLVEQNDIEEGGGQGWGDQNSAAQWASARRALAPLQGRIPLAIATGNHDYGIRRAEDRRTRFNNHFAPTDNPLVSDGRGGGIWVESAPNAFGVRTLENAAYVLQPPFGRKLLVLALEWGPRRAVVEWARGLLGRPEYADHLALLLVHSYLLDNNERDGDRTKSGNPHTYGTGKDGDTHDGEDLWRELVRPARQLELVVCGHIMGRHTGYRCDPNAAGRPVHQMLFNAQGLGGGSDEKGNGGDGWIRLLTFHPDGRTLSVRTFSPHFLATGRDPWRRDPDHSFVIRFGP